MMDNSIVGQACDGIYRVTLYRDECPTSPREWEPIFKLCLPAHDRSVGGWSEVNMDDYMERKCIVWNQRGGSHFAFPIFYVDHGCSYQHFSTSCNVQDGKGPWPRHRGPVGYGIADVKRVRHETGREDEKYSLEEVKEVGFACWKSEIKLLDWYLNGEVYGYMAEHLGEHLDSCWGFFGDDLDEVKEAMADNLGGEKYDHQKVIDMLKSIEYGTKPEKYGFDEMEMLASFAI